MPEMTLEVRWPDGSVESCYSPSLVMHDHLRPGRDYTVAEFVARASAGLDEAGERVRAAYGFACTSAIASRDAIRRRAGGFADDALVAVLAMEPPLPEASAPVPVDRAGASS